VDSGADRDVLTEDAHRAFSVDDTPRERALCSKADKNHAAIRAPKIVLEVVTHAPVGRHARSGHDDGPAADIVQRDRFGPLPCEVEPGQPQRVMSLSEQPGSFRLQTLRMMPKASRLVLDRSGADPKVVGNLFVGISSHQSLEDIALAVRQPREAGLDIATLGLTLLIPFPLERRPHGRE
jgi:hypothetical protein